MKNAIVYLRRSTRKEEQEKPIPDQLAEVKVQAKRENCHLVEELLYRYIDDGISGRSKKDRRGFLQILEDAKSGLLKRYGVEIVLYWATDRLARNTLNALEIQDKLEQYGISLYSVTERYDLSTDSGRIQFIMCSMFAEERSNQISRDTKRGLKQKAIRGEYGCPVPAIGYKRDGDKNLVIDEEQARVVKLMFIGLHKIRPPLKRRTRTILNGEKNLAILKVRNERFNKTNLVFMASFNGCQGNN